LPNVSSECGKIKPVIGPDLENREELGESLRSGRFTQGKRIKGEELALNTGYGSGAVAPDSLKKVVI
jgi:hypothetical protein